VKEVLARAESAALAAGISFRLDNPERLSHESGTASSGKEPLWSLDRGVSAGRPRFPACEAPFSVGTIRVDGSICPCCYCRPLASMTGQSFASIWNGQAFRAFRQQLRTPNGPYPGRCSTCTAKGWCYCLPAHLVRDNMVVGISDFNQLGLGWYPRDSDNKLRYRFTDESATVFIRNSGKPTLRIKCCVYAPPGGITAKKVDVSVNDRPVGSFTASTIWKDYFIWLPVTWGKLLKVSLTVDPTHVPCRTYDTFDFRRMGIAVSLIKLVALNSVQWWLPAPDVH